MGRRASPPPCLDLGCFRQRQRVLHFNTKVSNCRFNLGVAEQDLHCAQITSLLVDQGCLGASKGMGAIVLSTKSDRRDPFVD